MVRIARLGLQALCIACAVIMAASPAVAAETWRVDGGNSSCSDSGPGSSVEPFCTVGAGARNALPGDSVLVWAGTYREQVTPPVSGDPGVPITFRAAGPGAVLLGTSNLSDPAGWSATATTAWSRSYAPLDPPTQVFLDGARLSTAPSGTETMSDSFFYDAFAKVLYMDVGGGNPAEGHVVEAGAGILSESGGGGIVVEGNDVSYAATHGIRLLNSAGAMVSGNTTHHNGFHGISLQGSNGRPTPTAGRSNSRSAIPPTGASRDRA